MVTGNQNWIEIDREEFRRARGLVRSFEESSDYSRTPKWEFGLKINQPAEVEDFQHKFLQVLKQLLQPGEFLYVLDYFHTCYRFYPKGFKNAGPWVHPLISNGDDLDIFSENFHFGIFTNFQTARVTVFGTKLLDLWKQPKNRPIVFQQSR